MTNEFELSDEQLAAVAGGSSSRININQLAANFGIQTNAVNSNTNVLALGGGKNSSTAAAAEGSVNNVGNLLVGINSNNA
jgi:hypothetical protein